MKNPPVLFHERLFPPFKVFVVVDALLAMVAVAFGAVYGPVLGWSTFIVLGLTASLSLMFAAPVIKVTATHLHAGRALLPHSCLGTVSLLNENEARSAHNSDARLFLQYRPGRDRTALLIENVDPADPHPGWLLTTKGSMKLRLALLGARPR